MLQTNLYSVGQQYIAAYEALFADQDIPEEAVKDTLEGIAGEFREKAINVAALIKNIEAHAAQVKEAELTMIERRRRLENQAEKLRDYLANNIRALPEDQHKIFTPDFEIRLKKCPPSVKIEDRAVIPDEYMRVIPERKEPDKTKLKEALQAGVELKDIYLTVNYKVEIK